MLMLLTLYLCRSGTTGELETPIHPVTYKDRSCKRKAGMAGQTPILQGKRAKGRSSILKSHGSNYIWQLKHTFILILGGYTEQLQRDVASGEGGSHDANEMCYLYTDDAYFDLQSQVTMEDDSAAEDMDYLPTPFPVNDQLFHSENAQQNETGSNNGFSIMSFTKLVIRMKGVNLHYFPGATTSTSVLQPHMPYPVTVSNVAGSTSYIGEHQTFSQTSVVSFTFLRNLYYTKFNFFHKLTKGEEHMRFEARAGRLQQNSRRRNSNHASTSSVNARGKVSCVTYLLSTN